MSETSVAKILGELARLLLAAGGVAYPVILGPLTVMAIRLLASAGRLLTATSVATACGVAAVLTAASLPPPAPSAPHPAPDERMSELPQYPEIFAPADAPLGDPNPPAGCPR